MRPPAVDRRGHTGWVVARFALTSLLVFVMVGVAVSYLRARDLRTREEDSAAARAQLVADGIIAPILTPDLLSTPMSGAGLDRVQELVHQILVNDRGIERVKIWSLGGTVLYSNDPTEIGGHSTESDLAEAAEGHVESDVSDLSKTENAGERPLASKLFETYVPVRLSPGGPVVAIVEVYRDYSTIQSEIDRLAGTLTISLGAGLLALYALLLPLMVGTTRKLRGQNDQLSDQASQLGELLEREQETVAELRELDRMKADFVAASSHELRSPLTSILGYARILRAGAADDPIANEAVDAIERQSNRMLRLVMNLLTESRIEAGRSEPAVTAFEVAALIDEVVGDFHRDGGRIRVERAEGEARCDRGRVSDILVNLIDNALKYAEPDTSVIVGASVAHGDLTLRVRDQGPGIEPGDIPRIFDRFYQADQSATRAHGGVGLGLHIVRGLVESMDGRIAVQSRRGEGSEFTVTIPMVPAEAAPAHQEQLQGA